MKNRTKRQKAGPIEVKVGNVVVKIYRSERRKGDSSYTQFDVADYSGGPRKLHAFASEQKARDKATEIATKLANREGDVLSLTGADKQTYLRALEQLKPTKLTLELAVMQFAEAHQKLGGRSLAEAVNFFVRRHPATLPHKTVAEVVNVMLAAKEADGLEGVYLKDLKMRLGKFAKSFQCQIADVSEAQINEWLRSLSSGPRSRNNYRLVIGTLFKFAVSAGFLPKDHLDYDKVTKAKEEHAAIEIFKPAELVKLLNAARLDAGNLKPGMNRRYAEGPGLLPLLVLGAFAGLRTREIERQQWEDINLERGFIRVTAAKGNTAQKRLIQPIHDNLKQWLAELRQDKGPVCEIARTPDAINRLAKRAGVTWKHNALRHSFISYRVAETQDVKAAAYEAGNSPAMIHAHYRELVEVGEAKEWFGIAPGRPANVVTAPAETRKAVA